MALRKKHTIIVLIQVPHYEDCDIFLRHIIINCLKCECVYIMCPV